MGIGDTMDGCGRCMKTSLLIINVVTFIGGAVAVGIGLWIWIARSFPSTLMSNNMFMASLVVVVVTGAVMMLLSFLGCGGAVLEIKCMLMTYYISVFIVFTLMLVSGILQFVFREKILITLDREMSAAIPFYGTKHEYTVSWDKTQTYLECCGVKGYQDWNDNVPESCCKELYPGKRLDCKTSPNPTTMHMDGCRDKLTKFLRGNAVYVGTTAMIEAIIMLVALILACGVFVKIK